MVQRLLIALAQVKSCSTSEKLLKKHIIILSSLIINQLHLIINLSHKINLSNKYVALWNLSIYYQWINIKNPCKNNKFKISAPRWNDEFELPNGSYSVSDIQDYFKYIWKKELEIVSDNLSLIIYVNRIENRITFKIKTWYYFDLLTPETMKLLGSTKSKITKDEKGENIPNLKMTEVELIHYNNNQNIFQQDLRVSYKFVLNKSFGQFGCFTKKFLYFEKFLI